MRPQQAIELQNLLVALYEDDDRPSSSALQLQRFIAETRLPNDPQAITATDTGGGRRLALVLTKKALFTIEITDDPDPKAGEGPVVAFRCIPLDPSAAVVSIDEEWGPANRSVANVSNWKFHLGRDETLQFTTHSPSEADGDPDGFAMKLAGALGWTV